MIALARRLYHAWPACNKRHTDAAFPDAALEPFERGISGRSFTAIVAGKYEKCISTIRKFDAGIIGMYDL